MNHELYLYGLLALVALLGTGCFLATLGMCAFFLLRRFPRPVPPPVAKPPVSMDEQLAALERLRTVARQRGMTELIGLCDQVEKVVQSGGSAEPIA